MRPAAVTERRAWAVRGGRRSYKGAWLRGGVVTRDVTPLGGMRSAAVSRVAWGCRGGGCGAAPLRHPRVLLQVGVPGVA